MQDKVGGSVKSFKNPDDNEADMKTVKSHRVDNLKKQTTALPEIAPKPVRDDDIISRDNNNKFFPKEDLTSVQSRPG